MDPTDMPYNEAQADLFDDLIAAGLTHAELQQRCRIGERQAYRIRNGDGLLLADHLAGLVGHPDPRIGDLVLDYLCGGTGRMSIQMDSEPGSADAAAVEAIEVVARLMRQRLADAADGVLTPDEAARQLDLVKAGVRAMHRLHESVAHQKPARQKLSKAAMALAQ